MVQFVPLVLALGITGRAWLPPLHSLPAGFSGMDSIPLSLPCSRLSSPRLPQPFPTAEMLQSFSILVAPPWTLSSLSTSLLSWGAQHWSQHPRGGLTSTEQRGRIPSLNLLAIFCLTQPRISLGFFVARAHWWLMQI